VVTEYSIHRHDTRHRQPALPCVQHGLGPASGRELPPGLPGHAPRAAPVLRQRQCRGGHTIGTASRPRSRRPPGHHKAQL